MLWDEDIETLDMLADMASAEMRLAALREIASRCSGSEVGSSALPSERTWRRQTPPGLAPPAEGVMVPTRELLRCDIRGYYPFPGRRRHGVLAWVFRDTHQAISVRSSLSPGSRLVMDFMTAGGQGHPVWWDDATKWQVLLGQSIDGHVRIRSIGQPSPKLEQLRACAQAHDVRMRLYTNNCRVFTARMQREVERLNDEDDSEASEGELRWRATMADARLTVKLVLASALPSLYPLGVLALCWQGLSAA
jgi:hypothetical protein